MRTVLIVFGFFLYAAVVLYVIGDLYAGLFGYGPGGSLTEKLREWKQDLKRKLLR